MSTKTRKPAKITPIQFFKKLKRAAKKDVAELEEAPGKQTVTLTVTGFRDIFSDWLRGDGTLGLCKTRHKVTVKGHELEPGEGSIKRALSELVFKKGVPNTVKLTIKSEDKRHHYFPVGIAFLPKPNGAKPAARMFERDFKAAQAYLLGEHMFFILGPKFNTSDLSKYAVIIQRKEDAQVGIIDPGIGNTCA
jgi:hypothetical protein